MKKINMLVLVIYFTCLVSAFSGSGSGTITNPYQITNCAQMQEINNSLSSNYILMNNIDCTATSTWESGKGWYPVGQAAGSSFSGTLYGNGYIVSNLYINRGDVAYYGLFGYATTIAIITDLGLINISYLANPSVKYGAVYVGGIAGFSRGQINNSYSTGIINFTSSIGQASYTGGLAGYTQGTVTDCYSTANVSTADGSVAFTNIGGLIGENQATVKFSYANGTVTGNNSADMRGGLVGNDYQGAIFDCYSTGIVNPTGGSFGGGLVGVHSTGGLYADTNNFYDNQTSGWVTSDMGTGKNTTQMKSLATFTSINWDISNISNYSGQPMFIDDMNDYPKCFFEYLDKYNMISPAYFKITANNTQATVITKFSIFFLGVHDLYPFGTYIFSTNNTGSWVNDSPVIFSSINPSYANVTKILGGTVGTTVNYMWYFNDSTNNTNSSLIYSLTTENQFVNISITNPFLFMSSTTQQRNVNAATTQQISYLDFIPYLGNATDIDINQEISYLDFIPYLGNAADIDINQEISYLDVGNNLPINFSLSTLINNENLTNVTNETTQTILPSLIFQQNCSFQYFKTTKFLKIPFSQLYYCILGKNLQSMGKRVWPEEADAGTVIFVILILLLIILVVYIIKRYKKDSKDKNKNKKQKDLNSITI